ncbi:MAG TPA: sigma-70 family RNA polymerase sigma factor [Xanthomonadales bacterium]|nr:sigma-70 family RNA polymerase sigma factor [Xanthomonadales bacterium]
MSKQFRQWVEEYQDQAWTLARYMLRDHAEAEDVCQESFVKLWHHQDRIDQEKAKPWLMRVIRNGCLDRIRRRKPEGDLQGQAEASDAPGPMEDLEQRDTGRRLKAAIEALNEPYRSLVVLRDVQQHSYAEVAGTLDLSMSQVKVYLHRARKQLREELAPLRA